VTSYVVVGHQLPPNTKPALRGWLGCEPPLMASYTKSYSNSMASNCSFSGVLDGRVDSFSGAFLSCDSLYSRSEKKIVISTNITSMNFHELKRNRLIVVG
jgi:hypothetical protein